MGYLHVDIHSSKKSGDVVIKEILMGSTQLLYLYCPKWQVIEIIPFELLLLINLSISQRLLSDSTMIRSYVLNTIIKWGLR